MYNLALIGCGRISGKHIKAATVNSDKIRLVACCDLERERADNGALEFLNLIGNANGTRESQSPSAYTDYKEMLSKEDIDIVAICTESGYHAEIAVYCMKQKKHVIVEKPMALSTDDAEQMILISKENNIKLCVVHQNRFNTSIQKLRQALEAGRFGRIIGGNARILWNREEDYYSQAPWRGTYKLDGGCLMNQCIHNIDLLQWMLGGDIQWVHGAVNNFAHSYIEAEDYGSIQIGFTNGAIGNVEGTVCVYPNNLEETLTIIGEKGIASIGGIAVNKIETWRFADGLDDERQIISANNEEIDSVYGNGHILLYRDVIDSIETDREPKINGEEGKVAMEIILATYLSSKEGRRIIFPISKIGTIDFE